ncbi:hypothetical protein C0J52_03702 [Blattella germanica]|nr:hypothetical protein C0J52_03702 [Blattella germanica]
MKTIAKGNSYEGSTNIVVTNVRGLGAVSKYFSSCYLSVLVSDFNISSYILLLSRW